MNLRLSLTFKMTYFACCYPITNELVCVRVRACACYTAHEEFVCVSKSSGID